MDDTPSPGSDNSKDTFGRPLHRRAATEPNQRLPQSSTSLRWSEIVPPDSALRFAVILDGDQEFDFSDSELLQTPKHDSKATPLDVTDAQSQILLLPGRHSDGDNTAHPSMVDDVEPNTATLAFFRENHEFLFKDHSSLKLSVKFDDKDRPSLGRTQTSSTLDGVGDVYITGSMFSKVYGANNRLISCCEKLDGNFQFDPRTSFACRWSTADKAKKEDNVEEVIDEGFFENPIDGLPVWNASSPTKASAQDTHLALPARPINPSPLSNESRRLDQQEADDEWRWSTIETPTTPAALGPIRFATQQEAQRRRLRKVRPALSPTSTDSAGSSTPKSPASPAIPFDPSIHSIAASPSLVLKRTKYNHEALSPNSNPSSLPSRQDKLFAPRMDFPTLEAVREGMARPSSPLPFPGVPVASSLPKLVRTLGNSCKSLKSSVHKGQDGWVCVDIKQEITQRNV